RCSKFVVSRKIFFGSLQSCGLARNSQVALDNAPDRGYWLPPLTAGTIEISAPAGRGVESPPVSRLFSVPTKTLICSRILSCSVNTQPRPPGKPTHNSHSPLTKFHRGVSFPPRGLPAVKCRRGPGI